MHGARNTPETRPFLGKARPEQSQRRSLEAEDRHNIASHSGRERKKEASSRLADHKRRDEREGKDRGVTCNGGLDAVRETERQGSLGLLAGF